MRVFFVGNVIFSKFALLKLIDLKVEIIAVATKSRSDFNSDHFDLSELCKAYAIPSKYVRDINAPHIVGWIRSLCPDIIFVFGWSSLMKKELLDLPPMGILGFHPALLPTNRGRHPIIWALALGLKETASSFFFMDEGADSGDLLSQKSIDISYSDDASSLYDKICKTASSQLDEFLPQLQNNLYECISQKNAPTNYWRKRSLLDGQIDFRMSSRAIYNLVRALARPYVGAHLLVECVEVKIWKINEVEFNIPNYEPGKVLNITDNTILVKTYDGAIEIVEHEFKTLPKVNTYL